MLENKYISSRADRYGANYIPALSYIFLCEKINNDLLYHNCDKKCIRYKNTILHKYLEYKTSKCTDSSIINNDIHRKCNSWATKCISKEIFEKTGKPFPDIFHNSEIYNDIRNTYFDKYGKESLTSNSIIIHVRLDDVIKYNSGIKQQFIGKDNLIYLINHLLNKFELDIFLITTNNKIDKEICMECLKKSNFKMKRNISYYILGSNDIDYDIYLMMTSKVLILSRSTFSFIPAILHKNIVYTYTEWSHYFDLLGSDKSQKIQLLQQDYIDT
tara:strand:- start:171 stop:986 length:816 start_codon:yes stop_codon:yes gene_type:complete